MSRLGGNRRHCPVGLEDQMADAGEVRVERLEQLDIELARQPDVEGIGHPLTALDGRDRLAQQIDLAFRSPGGGVDADGPRGLRRRQQRIDAVTDHRHLVIALALAELILHLRQRAGSRLETARKRGKSASRDWVATWSFWASFSDALNTFIRVRSPARAPLRASPARAATLIWRSRLTDWRNSRDASSLPPLGSRARIAWVSATPGLDRLGRVEQVGDGLRVIVFFQQDFDVGLQYAGERRLADAGIGLAFDDVAEQGFGLGLLPVRA